MEKVIEHGVELDLKLVVDVLGVYGRGADVSEERFEAICEFVHARFKRYYNSYVQTLKDYVSDVNEVTDGVIRREWKHHEIMLLSKTFAILSEKGLYELIKYYQNQN